MVLNVTYSYLAAHRRAAIIMTGVCRFALLCEPFHESPFSSPRSEVSEGAICGPRKENGAACVSLRRHKRTMRSGEVEELRSHQEEISPELFQLAQAVTGCARWDRGTVTGRITRQRKTTYCRCDADIASPSHNQAHILDGCHLVLKTRARA